MQAYFGSLVDVLTFWKRVEHFKQLRGQDWHCYAKFLALATVSTRVPTGLLVEGGCWGPFGDDHMACKFRRRRGLSEATMSSTPC